MLMLKCKSCGEVFPGIYVPEENNNDFKAAAIKSGISRTCSRGHQNSYATEDYMDWS
jgi:hypothetical protein